VDADEDRNLRRAGIAGAIGVVGAAAWGVFIFAGIAISGYTLGRDVLTDVLAVAPPLAAGGVLAYGAAIAVRDVRRDDWLVRLIAVVLFLAEGALGLSLLGYGGWAGSQVAHARATRTARADQPRVQGESTRPVRPEGTSAS
jgi:hypothetical protein